MESVARDDIDLLDFFSDNGNGDGQPRREPLARESPTGDKGFNGDSSSSRALAAQLSAADHSCPPRPSEQRKQHGRPADFTEEYSGLRVRNRLLSSEDVRLRLRGRSVHRLSELKTAPLQTTDSQDPANAWATIGVLTAKSQRRQAANGKAFCIWTLSDLSRKEHDASVFLFQDALSSHWTTCEGTLVALLGAKPLPPKERGAKVSFCLDAPWQVSDERDYSEAVSTFIAGEWQGVP